MRFDKKNHWEGVYTKKIPAEVSWYQLEPAISLKLITSAGISLAAKIIDVGGGASVLVDKLTGQGFQDLTVLDVSPKALEYAKERLGSRAGAVKWIEADVTEFESPEKYDLWHDRAVFHFLTKAEDRQKYVRFLHRALKKNGHVIIATFDLDGGSLRCSGLDIMRHNAETLQTELGEGFQLVESVKEVHHTPFQTEQKFIYCHFQRV
ncbi:MAG: methyltransferase [Omnitrophica bacterium RIFCSPLOWO2_12_FULL_44_17]|uniref:Methyltransferase n=1 Tax=Candidatus Danuiimicrobium aquiferis TaxID=1801832 RepID=A0A1G1L323_9BACT|nr:MAG: methyltransferase [Omnitrophica bacterium RIFCSPHIGHO2_02_FULL_45_28]OGW99279.1 MAG: methyltransferase [Omnitrophica bacterium RIFCSPLOWO2_12_FULL_44_17]OGX02646.1 MAG: methyltransferase [Omnitrophica bacterium RIFCSPLOWO2_02_FULL_44_11]